MANAASLGQPVGAAGSTTASAANYCDTNSPWTARQLDRLLRVADIVKAAADASGHTVALVSRSGTDLSRFGLRYSHAGISLQGHANGAWGVRQLYYACDERRPRVFDQGMSGFLLGTDNADLGYVSLVMLPAPDAALVARAAQNNALGVGLLAPSYSANAHPTSLRFQNCNQWVAELLAAAWGKLEPALYAVDAQGGGHALRAQAQSWLARNGYATQGVHVNSHALMFLAPFVSMIHTNDHPEDDRLALKFHTSLPADLEALLRLRVPGAQRIEFCHDAHKVVVHQGWEPIAPGCVPGAGDRVIAWD